MAEVGTIATAVATHFHTPLTTMATPPGTLMEVIEKHSGGQGDGQGKEQGKQKVAVAATDEEVELTYGELGGEIQHILLPLLLHSPLALSPHFLPSSPLSCISLLIFSRFIITSTSSQIFFSTPLFFLSSHLLLLLSLS